MGNFFTVVLYVIGLLIGTAIVSAIIFVIASKFAKTAIIPACIAGVYAIFANIYVAINNDELMRIAAIISTVIVVMIITAAIIILKDESNRNAKKQNQTITEDDLKKDE